MKIVNQGVICTSCCCILCNDCYNNSNTHISTQQAICFRCNASIDYTKSIDLRNNNMLKSIYTNSKLIYSIPQLRKVTQLLENNSKATGHLHISAIEERIKVLQSQSPVKQPLIHQITNSLHRNSSNNPNKPLNNNQIINYDCINNIKPIEENIKYLQSIFNTQSTTDKSYTPAKKKCKRSFVMMTQEKENNESNTDNKNSDINFSNITNDKVLSNKSKKYKYM